MTAMGWRQQRQRERASRTAKDADLEMGVKGEKVREVGNPRNTLTARISVVLTIPPTSLSEDPVLSLILISELT